MSNKPASASKRIGYCTNVHAGMTLDEVKTNLEKFAVPVRDELAGESGELGVGLWLSFLTTEELLSSDAIAEFRDWLAERRLTPYTFNGFPFGNFHQSVVKQAVYEPTWADPQRLEYTRRLANIQAGIFDDDRATISTLPLGWPHPENRTDEFKTACGKNLITLTEHLARIHESTGKQIVVCLEPEPGCVFDTAVGLVEYFENFLFASATPEIESRLRNYLGVCHDVCHSAVMFETQESALSTYVGAGIEVAKVQVSSAIEADFETLEDEQRRELLGKLRQFAEPRYLHQTSIKKISAEGQQQFEFYDDLPDAIRAAGEVPRGLWRVHFHVPIFEKQYGLIGSTQADILSFLATMQKLGLQPNLEVETYAWNVLPSELQDESLARCVTRELKWFQDASK